jgi:glycosyltransferase involved in cell wall biosynthesis
LALPRPDREGDYVFSSGRASCDWPTLFAAARDQGWRLVVVCSRSDLALVQSLDEGVGARILSEISKDEHDRLLAGAAVCVVSLREDHKSSGQVRLGAAIELDVPVVASEVEGLKGYLRHGVNALAFPAGDSVSLRNQVARLLADAEARRALTASARSACEGYDRSAYFRELALRVERAQRADRG